ncbi:chorismate mutase [Micrococcus porci]|uniref:chorismate mutase n=1 Tax=Micrococcus TaxID=1269 RepID=UPI001CCA1815|nr:MULTISPECIES: chorismate mutase [Micrococcus]MCG7422470.1 chorismate mutase [Micrococcus sp. ACRRV]UBH23596.1 chorismate mutase [Micrococcus porci]
MSHDYDPHASSLAGTADQDILEELYEIRGSIDNIDASLVYLLAERFKFTQRVGRLKARHALPPSDPGREAAQIERLQDLARDADLEPEFAEKFLNFIIAEVIRHHRAIAEDEAPVARPAEASDAGSADA